MAGDNSGREKTALDRRRVMGGVAALGLVSVATVSAGSAKAAENQVGDQCLTVLYPYSEGATFDFDYYINHHIPLVLGFYGDSIRKYEIFKPAVALGGAQPSFIAMANIWIADMEGFVKAGDEHRDDFMPDVANFTNVTPVGLTHDLVAVI